MISTEITRASIEIAEELDRRGLGLKPRSDSPVEALVNASRVDFVAPRGAVLSEEEMRGDYTPNPEEILADTTIPSMIDPEKSVHDLEMDSLVATISDAVSQHLSFAKNTVRPLVKTLASTIQQRIAAYPTTATFNPNIVKWDLPTPMLDELVKETLMEYNEVPFGIIDRVSVSLPAVDETVARELVKTGSGNVDGMVTEWLATKPENYVSGIYNSVFVSQDVGQVAATFESLVSDRLSGTDAAFVIYLLASKLIGNPPEGVTLSLAEYRVKIGDIVNQAGLRLAKAYAKRELDINTKLMIMKYSTSEVVVVAPVYDAWVAAGGNNAVIFGTICSDRPSLFVEAIDATAEASMRMWEQQNRFLTVVQSNKRFVALKEAIVNSAESLIATQPTECFGALIGEGVIDFNTKEVALAVAKIHTYVDGLQESDLNDVWRIATELVTKCIFYYTDSYKILMGIDAAFKENDGIDVNEAALISLVEYVSDYVSDQLLIVDL
jgi:hypothetical protein